MTWLIVLYFVIGFVLATVVSLIGGDRVITLLWFVAWPGMILVGFLETVGEVPYELGRRIRRKRINRKMRGE